jgi:peptidoglycan/LPS O-acetylase OafA/YrhL
MNAHRPAVVAPPQGNPRFPLLDGLRAVAALAVVALHTTVYTDYFRGWEGAYARQLACGVTVFFVLTGFLLYRPFLAARISSSRPVRLRDYARRRALRIVPAFWLALTVLAIWPGLPGGPLGSHWWRYYGFLQDFDGHTLFDGLGTGWSLGTEVSFYLLLPLYALLLARLSRRRSVRGTLATELSVLAALSAFSLLLRLALWGTHPNLCYTLLGTFDWFAVGMALAVLSVAADHDAGARRVALTIGRHPTLSWAIALIALTLAAAYWQLTHNYASYSAGPLHLIWATVALFIVLPAIFAPQAAGAPGRVLSIPLVAWLGIISYGIYLWHLPLVTEIGRVGADLVGAPLTGLAATVFLFALVTTAVVLCAAASYYLVERPLLRFKDGVKLSALRARPGSSRRLAQGVVAVDVAEPSAEA